MRTARDLTPADMARYRAAARRRHQAEQEALALRERQARELARQAADLLRAEFHAERVVLFGSLVHPGSFTEWSDIDIAAAGLAPAETLRAMERVHDLSTSIDVNLVDLAACSASLREVIEREGVPL